MAHTKLKKIITEQNIHTLGRLKLRYKRHKNRSYIEIPYEIKSTPF